jgi:aminopeptidase N
MHPMNRLKFSQLLISLFLVLSFLAGCTGTTTPTTPTFTAVPPTPVVVEASETPSGSLNTKPKPGSPGIGDSLYPHLGNGGYDVQHYTLDLTVHDVPTGELEGITTIEAQATQSLSSFNLDFLSFEVTEITVNGQPADFEHNQQELTITPSTPLAENESFTVEIKYQGSPGEARSNSPSFQIGWITFEGGSFVLSEPDGSSSFFPVNDHPLDKASYTFRVTVPEPFEVGANGALIETTDNGETTTFVFEARDPMASYLATINIDEFDIETSQTENGVPIRNYYPTGLSETFRRPFERQDEMLVYFSDIFGPYPFEVYGALVIDREFGAALETQTLSIFSIAMIDPNQIQSSEEVVAHELAHQWFGDSVSVGDWRDIWLNESFATYAQALWLEHTQGPEALDGRIRDLYDFVRRDRDSMWPPGEPPAEALFNIGVYYWGALCLHALRLEVGDEHFFQILKTYHEQYKGGNARTADFIAVAEGVSGKELSAFFDSWLYSDELAPIPALGLEAR